jgi:outer membrane lipoprotein-sorting protein
MDYLRLNRLILISIFFAFLINANASSDNIGELSVKNILEKVDVKYSTIESYKDWGVVETKIKKVKFETYYVRPNLFLFKWESSYRIQNKVAYNRYYQIWLNNEGAYTLHDYNKPDSVIEKEESIGMAIAGATGISSGAAYKIGSLLMDEPDGWLVANPNVPEIIGVEKIRDNECYHIKDIHPRTNTEYHLWIDTHSYLVHRVKTIDPDHIVKTDFYEIIVNGDINLDVFNPQRVK